MSVKEALLRCIVVLLKSYISKEVEAGQATKRDRSWLLIAGLCKFDFGSCGSQTPDLANQIHYAAAGRRKSQSGSVSVAACKRPLRLKREGGCLRPHRLWS